MTPGLYKHMPAAQYHATPALSASGLKLMRHSPQHFFGGMLDPARPVKEPAPALRNGQITHCATFEPAALADRYVVKPEGHDGRTAAGKAWAADVAQRGLEVVTSEDMARAKAQAAALLRLPDIAALLKEGYPEASAFWQDVDTSVLCKCRPDWVTPVGTKQVILTDGKTTRDASPDGFGRAIHNLGYHLQAAWYSDGFEAATGLEVVGFVFAAVESEWPHAAAAYMLGDDVLDAARRVNKRLTTIYAECLLTGRWPGYEPGINLITLPRWAQLEINAA